MHHPATSIRAQKERNLDAAAAIKRVLKQRGTGHNASQLSRKDRLLAGTVKV